MKWSVGYQGRTAQVVSMRLVAVASASLTMPVNRALLTFDISNVNSNKPNKSESVRSLRF